MMRGGEKGKTKVKVKEKVKVKVLDIRREGETAVIIVEVKRKEETKSFTILKPWSELVKMKQEAFQELLKKEVESMLVIEKLKKTVVEV